MAKLTKAQRALLLEIHAEGRKYVVEGYKPGLVLIARGLAYRNLYGVLYLTAAGQHEAEEIIRRETDHETR